MMRLLACIALSLAASSFARAFVSETTNDGKVLKWNLTTFPASVPTNSVNPATKAIRYFIASDGYSATNRTAELNAIRASFAQWQSIPGTVLKFEEAGVLGPGVDVNTSDKTNVVYWTRSRLVNGGTVDMTGVLGFGFFSYFSDGTIKEGDVVLNGAEPHIGWFTDFSDTSNTNYFVEGVALHEIGHVLGLRHSPVGGATMMVRGARGISAQAGLSQDEIAAARALYPQSGIASVLGHVRGQVTRNGSGVFGAVVVVEDGQGNIVSGTLTGSGGMYELPAIPPGNYHVRATPLDPAGASPFLLKGSNISPEFSGADTSFQPSQAIPQTLQPGATNTVNIPVASGAPPYWISHIRKPTSDQWSYSAANTPYGVLPGQSNITVGVFGPSLPASGATLAVSGEGVTMGATSFENVFPGLNGLSATISISATAAPGLRSFIIRQGTNNVYANGFLEILPPVPDYNFDGLDDRFQRQHFALFTSAEASPSADDDMDGFSNLLEYLAGTNPRSASSKLQIERVIQTAEGTAVEWQSAPGKTYNLLYKEDLASDSWLPAVTGPVTASGSLTQLLDPGTGNRTRFYRVQVIP